MEKKTSGLAIASLICGLIAFMGCCNPLYLVSIVAVVLGIIALVKGQGKIAALVGIIAGAVAIPLWIIIDILLAPFTLGGSFFI